VTVPPRSLVGRHPSVGTVLDGTNVADGQRARLLEAMAQVVADKGYAATTVSDVVRAARVSRSTFYDLFESKEQCFVEAYRHGVEVMFDDVRAARRAARDQGWRVQVRASNLAYLESLRSEPTFARTYLLEIHTAGPAALDARAEALGRFADGFRRLGERIHPDGWPGTPPPREAYQVLAAGLDQLAAHYVRSGRAERLPSLEPTFTYCAIAVLEGGDAQPSAA
jgi:AcrR family transcriptional regulator